MKKLFLVIMISPMLIGCNFNNEKNHQKKGIKFEEIGKTKEKKSFNFDNKNSYSQDSIKETDLHPGCTAPCCSSK
tara:strand:- start:315 stop:539 length:225 start_codon:yes stop_codon:yes gene_type:complete